MSDTHPSTKILEDLFKEKVLDQIHDAVKESIENGYTPNYLLLGPELSTYIPEDIVEFSGMKLWRSSWPLPQWRPVIAIQLSPMPTKVRISKESKTE